MAEDVKKGKEKDGEHGHEAPVKKSKKMLFIIIGVVVLLIGGGGAFYMLKIKKGPDAEQAGEEGGHGETAKKGEKAEKGGHGEKGEGAEATGPQLIALDPFIVNLMNATATRYLKVTVNMDVDAEAVEEITAKTAQVRDTIIILLSSKSYNDVGTVTGKYQLRDEIVARVNMILETGKVNAVYFTEFVIQ